MEILNTGDNVFLEFYADPQGRVIARASDGRIALVSREYKGVIKAGSTISCEVIEVFPKKVVVMPIEVVVTAEENSKKMAESLVKLKDKDWNKPSGKSRRPLRNWELVNKNFSKDATL